MAMSRRSGQLFDFFGRGLRSMELESGKLARTGSEPQEELGSRGPFSRSKKLQRWFAESAARNVRAKRDS